MASENEQLKFLLKQAPMLDAPDSIERAAHAVTKYAYINPKTFEKIVPSAHLFPPEPAYQIKPSPTKWILSVLMPEDRVIFSSNVMPGLINA